MAHPDPSDSRRDVPRRFFPPSLDPAMLQSVSSKLGLKTWGRVALLSGVVGVFAGISAAGFKDALDFTVSHVIDLVYPTSSVSIFSFKGMNYLLVLVPMLGALFGSLLIRLLVRKKSDMHGTGEVINAFHHGKGVLDWFTPIVKGVAAIALIGSGGSTGPEGPIAYIGAGWGSWIGRKMKVSVRDRRRLLLAGAAAGMGAIFQAPLGAAIMGSEMLYRDTDFEHDAIVPCLIASVTSYAAFISIIGYQGPLFVGILSWVAQIYQKQGIHFVMPDLQSLAFKKPLELLAYLGLAGLAVATNIFFVKSYFWLHNRFFKSLKIWGVFKPMVGGLLLGLLVLVAPPIMDASYTFLGRLFMGPQAGSGLAPWVWVAALAVLLIFKIIGTGFTVASGGSGGLLGPSLFIGGVMGALWGQFLFLTFAAMGHGAWISTELQQSLVIVGMAAFFGSSNRIPVAAVIMLSEMTGAHGLLVPLMLTCAVSYVIGRRWGINPEQVESLSDSPAHFGDYAVDVLADLKVHEVLHQNTTDVRLAPGATLENVLETMKHSPQECFPVVGKQGQLEGVVHLHDIRKVLHEDRSLEQFLTARDLAVLDYPTISANADLHAAVKLMAERGVQDLVVMTDDQPPHMLGVLSHHDISAAYAHRTEDLALMDESEARIERLKRRSLIGHGQDVQEVPVPEEIVGLSLRNSNFRQKYGKQVVGIRDPGNGTLQIPADPDVPLQAHHVLLVLSQTNGQHEEHAGS